MTHCDSLGAGPSKYLVFCSVRPEVRSTTKWRNTKSFKRIVCVPCLSVTAKKLMPAARFPSCAVLQMICADAPTAQHLRCAKMCKDGQRHEVQRSRASNISRTFKCFENVVRNFSEYRAMAKYDPDVDGSTCAASWHSLLEAGRLADQTLELQASLRASLRASGISRVEWNRH
eukprot:s2261_g9.t1